MKFNMDCRIYTLIKFVACGSIAQTRKPRLAIYKPYIPRLAPMSNKIVFFVPSLGHIVKNSLNKTLISGSNDPDSMIEREIKTSSCALYTQILNTGYKEMLCNY